jgi:anthranilate synthase component 1
VQPDFDAFAREAETQTVVPVWEEWVAETIDPVKVYRLLGPGPGSFVLESSEGGRLARYTIIGRNPWLSFISRGKESTVIVNGSEERVHGNCLGTLKEVISRYRLSADSRLPRYWGGGVGYFAYDWVRNLERLPSRGADDLGLPDCWLVFPREVLIFDHWRRCLQAVIFVKTTSNLREAYRMAAEELREVRRRLEEKPPRSPEQEPAVIGGLPTSNFTSEQFCEAVAKAKEYIFAGDIFQVVLSQRWATSFDGSPLAVYRVLRRLNPSPYMFYLDLGAVRLVGSSPEMLVRVEGTQVETNPIAGTRPRGRTLIQDAALERELVADPKERAEHVMLVDLARNDLGRVCAAGTVRVSQFMEVEKYSHVMHLVSRVQGELAPEFDPVDVLAACFPAGTVSGAPKVRAMEIIEELEPVRRGPYAGAVGYVSLNGNLDTCLAIRTLIFAGGKVYLQAGAGIVAGSNPQAEYHETVNKAKALFRALEIASSQELYSALEATGGKQG